MNHAFFRTNRFERAFGSAQALSRTLALLLIVARGIPNLPAAAESHVVSGSFWKYYDAGSAPATGWQSASFNDSAWASGRAQLGFGDGDEATTLHGGITTAYFRIKFNVLGANTFTSLVMRVLRDDG